MPLPFEWFNYNVLKNFTAVEIKGETRIKTHTIPLLKPTARQNVLRKRRIAFLAGAFFLLTQYTAINFVKLQFAEKVLRSCLHETTKFCNFRLLVSAFAVVVA